MHRGTNLITIYSDAYILSVYRMEPLHTLNPLAFAARPRLCPREHRHPTWRGRDLFSDMYDLYLKVQKLYYM